MGRKLDGVDRVDRGAALDRRDGGAGYFWVFLGIIVMTALFPVLPSSTQSYPELPRATQFYPVLPIKLYLPYLPYSPYPPP